LIIEQGLAPCFFFVLELPQTAANQAKIADAAARPRRRLPAGGGFFPYAEPQNRPDRDVDADARPSSAGRVKYTDIIYS